MNRSMDNFREILSKNFEDIIRCMFPLAFTCFLPWNREEDFLNNLGSAIDWSRNCSKNLPMFRMPGGYSFKVEGAKILTVRATEQ